MLRFDNKIGILLIAVFFITNFTVHSSITYNHQVIEKPIANTDQNSISGKIKVIILNQDGLYSDSKVNSIVDYIENNLTTEFNLNFNSSVISNSSTDFKLDKEVITLLNATDIQNAILIGSLALYEDPLFQHVLYNWSDGRNFQNIQNFGLIDYKRTDTIHLNRELRNFTFVTFDTLESGFMAGVKAGSLTNSSHVGLILDQSSSIGFETGFYSKQRFDTVNFVRGFTSGIQYASEHFKNNNEILLKMQVFNNDNSPMTEMSNILNDFNSFGVDVVFNLQSNSDDLFLDKANSLNMITGVYGGNSEANFSFIENTNLAIKNLVSNWESQTTNETHGKVFEYNLRNNSIMYLSDYSNKDSLQESGMRKRCL